MTGAAKPGKIHFVVATLGAEIARGGFAPGGTLPAEPDLAARFDASRTVIREAVKTLVAKGLVTVGPRHGTRVRPRDEWSLLDRDVLDWLASSGEIDQDLLEAIEEVRAIIEPAAAALAAQRATVNDRARIAASFEAMQAAARAADPVAAIEADKAFHLAILDATHNPVLQAFRGAIDAILSALFVKAVGRLEWFEGNLPQHGDVVTAIAARDPQQASDAMGRVISFTRANLRVGEPLSE